MMFEVDRGWTSGRLVFDQEEQVQSGFYLLAIDGPKHAKSFTFLKDLHLNMKILSGVRWGGMGCFCERIPFEAAAHCRYPRRKMVPGD